MLSVERARVGVFEVMSQKSAGNFFENVMTFGRHVGVSSEGGHALLLSVSQWLCCGTHLMLHATGWFRTLFFGKDPHNLIQRDTLYNGASIFLFGTTIYRRG